MPLAAAVKDFISAYLVIPWIFALSLYLSLRLGLPQVFHLRRALRHFWQKKQQASGDKLGSFAAIALILGGNLGVGNIAGIAVALRSGGPGSLFWLCVMAFLCAILKYAGVVLATPRNAEELYHRPSGGPMVYFRDKLKFPLGAQAFTILFLVCAASVGNLVQVNALVLPFSYYSISPLLVASCLTLLVGAIVSGGLKDIVHFINRAVPLMAILYLACCLLILLSNSEAILPACQTIISSAFGVESLAGGAIGFSVAQAIIVGFDRGLFATDSGLGLEAIVHSSIYDPLKGLPNHVSQGLISLISPLIVPLICLVTGLTFMVTGLGAETGSGAMAAVEAFRLGIGPLLGPILMLVVLFCFAFTTILTWYYCGEKCATYLWGKKAEFFWRLFFVGCIPLGSMIESRWLWAAADYATNFTLLINTVGIACLSKTLLRESKVLRRPNA